MTYKTQYIIKCITLPEPVYLGAVEWTTLIEDAFRYPGYSEALEGMDKMPKGTYLIEKIFLK